MSRGSPSASPSTVIRSPWLASPRWPRSPWPTSVSAPRSAGPRLHELIAVFDCPAEQIPKTVIETVREISSSLKITLLGYNGHQNRVARLLKNGWVYAWMSWCSAIAHAQTRAVILHDLDAMPIGPSLFEDLYDHWLEANSEFCGISRYTGQGVTGDMNLVRTYELVLDAAYVRRRFRPIALFNKLTRIDGRVVNFDTTLNAQWQSPRRVVRPIDETQLVHASQLICQYNDLIAGRTDLAGVHHSLPMLPYLLYLGGDAAWLEMLGSQLEKPNVEVVSVFDRRMHLDGIPPLHWAWMEKLIRRLEQTSFGHTRPEVSDFLTGFIHRAGSTRTVGVETGASAIVER